MSDDLTEIQESNLQCLVLLLTVSPVHDESMGDDHLVQIVFIMSGDAEEVQLMALLIISDLEHKKPSLQVSAKHTALTHNVRQRRI